MIEEGFPGISLEFVQSVNYYDHREVVELQVMSEPKRGRVLDKVLSDSPKMWDERVESHATEICSLTLLRAFSDPHALEQSLETCDELRSASTDEYGVKLTEAASVI